MRGSQVADVGSRDPGVVARFRIGLAPGLRNRWRGRGRRRSPRWPAASGTRRRAGRARRRCRTPRASRVVRPSRTTHRGRGSRPADPTHRSRARRLASGAGPMARHRRPPGARAGPRRRASDWRTSASRIGRRSTAARRRSRNGDRAERGASPRERSSGRLSRRCASEPAAGGPYGRRRAGTCGRGRGGCRGPFETPRGAPPRCPRPPTGRRCSSAPAASAPGITGHDSFAASHTVMTQANASPRNGRIVLLVWPLMSMPISRITAMASGRTSARLGAGAERLEAVAAPGPHHALGHLAASAVVGAHEEDAGRRSPVVSMAQSYDGRVNAASSRVNVHRWG